MPEQSGLVCQKCGSVIPADGDELDENGEAAVDEKGKPIWRARGLLACEKCAKAAMAPAVKSRKLRPGEVVEEQESFDVPNVLIL